MSNQGTPTGYEPDVAPARYNDPAPTAKIASTVFVPPTTPAVVVQTAPSKRA